MKHLFHMLVLAVGLAAAGSAAFSQAMTPPRGSALRAAVLDGVRPMVEAEVGSPVEFVVEDMRVVGEWAFVMLTPQRPGGAPIEYIYTRYGQAYADDMFDNLVIALLRNTPSGWLVYQYDLGATDVVWIDWINYYPVPREVFPNY